MCQNNQRFIMKRKFHIVLSMLLIFMFGISHAQEKSKDVPVLKGPYLGQKPPGVIPEVFASGIISTKAPEQCIAFAPGGRELYFVRETGNIRKIFNMKEERTRWTSPRIVSFSGKYDDAEFSLSLDGNKLAFISKRPLDGKDNSIRCWDIWIVEKTTNGWDEPENPGSVINTDNHEVFPSFSSNGNLYFSSDRGGDYDIYVSRYVNGHYLQAEKLCGGINTEHGEWDQAIAPDGSYMIFCSIGRPDSYGGSDLYISFRGEDGSWKEAKNMGDKMNSSRGVCCPSISPNGQYLFFESSKGDDGDIYWVDTKIIDQFKSKIDKVKYRYEPLRALYGVFLHLGSESVTNEEGG
jgi:Tol biopolymer transport system component